ncbi:hypothetical protein L0U85_18695 [Glycomyces sp. L485]|uniref:hypothetical protein n=1 Tax=Glycomyces sp. L485 TaxID=2909235 RepID=UPI001F4B650C|nr:hypothetical protein [Glycomyces sp. L485]MCH7232866.1 hypothetical protein [Glycomyces sp. L485]
MAEPGKKASLFDQLAVGKVLGNGKHLELLDLVTVSRQCIQQVTGRARVDLQWIRDPSDLTGLESEKGGRHVGS